MIVKPTRSFGSNIRACRLGYHWSERHGAFVRMITDGIRNFIELAPVDAVPTKGIKFLRSRHHRRWWSDPAILDELPWLRNVRRIKRYVAVEVDDDGNIIKEIT